MGISGRLSLIVITIALCVIGCAGNPIPSAPDQDVSLTETQASSGIRYGEVIQPSGRFLISGGYIYFDVSNPADPKHEIIPIRESAIHLNILKFLEVNPCDDCFNVVGLNFPEPGILDFDIEIKHPFPDTSLDFSVFDVRGIIMLNGSYIFPESGKRITDQYLGDGGILTADGYTSLYNGSTVSAPIGDLQKYFEGNLATPDIPNSDINAYLIFKTDDLSNDRNAFYAGDSVVRTFSLKIPSNQFVLGYAVDANWDVPLESPVDDPITDFPITANCPEAWKINVMEDPTGEVLTDCGGSLGLVIDIYDWQGKDTSHPVLLECPELFDGTIEALHKSDEPDFTTYEAVITNEKDAAPGEYPCLISVEASENDPSGQPWLDLTAYQLFSVVVTEHEDIAPSAIAEAGQLSAAPGEMIEFDGSLSHDNDCDGSEIVLFEWDWENDGEYDTEGSQVEHSWDEGGTYEVQLRVTDDEGSTGVLDTPIEIEIFETTLPVAKAFANPTTRTAGFPISFSDDGSYDPDGGTITEYEWDWENDGDFDGTGSNVDHVYPIPGNYQVQFRVTDDEGEKSILEEPIGITIVQKPIPIDITPPWLNFSPRDVVLRGDYLYVCAYYNGLHIFDVSDINNPTWLSKVDIDWRAMNLVLNGNYAYVVKYEGELLVVDITNPHLPSLVNTLEVVGSTGFYSCHILGNYLYFCGTDLYVIDISTPESPEIVNSFEFNGPVQQITTDGTYFYIAGTWMGPPSSGALYIAEIIPPDSCEIVNTILTNHSGGKLNGIEQNNGYVYMVSGESYPGRLEIFDVSDVENASLVKTLEYDMGLDDVSIYGDHAFAVSSSRDMAVFDVVPPESASLIDTVETGGAYGVTIEDGYAYVGGAYGIQVFDVDPVNDIYEISSLDSTWDAWDVVVVDGYAYVADLLGGLQIVDVDPPEMAHTTDCMRLDGFTYSIEVNQDLAYVGHSSVEIIDLSTPGIPQIIKTIPMEQYFYPFFMALDFPYLYAADHHQSMAIMDVGDVNLAHIVKTVSTLNPTPLCIDSADGYAYVTTSWLAGQLFVIDVDPPEDAHQVGCLTTPDYLMYSIAVHGNYAYMGTDDGLAVVDIENPAACQIIKTCPSYNRYRALRIHGNHLFALGGNLTIYDIGDPVNPVEVISILDWCTGTGIAITDGYAYLASGSSGLKIIQLY